MILSMTGFSKAEINRKGMKVTVEIRSVNGRGLDVNMRSPRSLADKEFEIRDRVKKMLKRGSVNINIYTEADTTSKEFNINTELVKGVKAELDQCRKDLKIKEAVKLEHVLQFSNFFTQREAEVDAALEWTLTKDAISKGLKTLVDMRKKEGSNIARDMNSRIGNIHKILKTIEDDEIDRIPREREKIRQRIAQVFDNDEIDESRLQMEMVILADKLDISEECVRLQSHIKVFYDTMKDKESKGPKLNFLLQEMLRETNTIGSKCNDANIAHKVVNMKEELERIREQVQNVE
ncbi:MAG: YicC/YloC family endoribonuclease [Candidatus Kapaibacterium sp.]